VVVLVLLFGSGGPDVARLSVTTVPPGALITINGEPFGPSPSATDVPPGAVRVQASAPGYRTFDSVITATSGIVPIEVVLTPEMPVRDEGSGSEARRVDRTVTPPTSASRATLVLQVIPNGSAVVDGVVKTGREPLLFSVDPGPRQVEFTHPRYGSKRTTLDVKSGERRELKCYFEGYVSVAVTGESQWGTIVVNGIKSDVQAPRARYPLGVGRHSISVTREGYRTMGGPKEVIIEPSLEEQEFNFSFMLRKQ
jgi:hypothetical protein